MLKRLMLVLGLGLVALAPMTQTAQAAGSDAVVTVEILENGDVEVTSTKDLSNVHIATCVEGEVKVVKFDSLNDKVEVFDVEGNLIAVLAHSGNNTTAEAEALLKLLGGKVSGNSTGTVVLFDEEALKACEPTTTTTQPPTTTTTAPPVTTTTVPPVTTTTAPPVTVTTVPEVPVTAVTAPPATDTPAPVAVPTPAGGGEEEIAFGGSWSAVMAAVGALVGLTGIALLVFSALIKRVNTDV